MVLYYIVYKLILQNTIIILFPIVVQILTEYAGNIAY